MLTQLIYGWEQFCKLDGLGLVGLKVSSVEESLESVFYYHPNIWRNSRHAYSRALSFLIAFPQKLKFQQRKTPRRRT